LNEEIAKQESILDLLSDEWFDCSHYARTLGLAQ
jgi:hypothetical protein